MSVTYAGGEVDLLGIYGHSAYYSKPMSSASFNVNQVPTMFFDYRPTVAGKVIMEVLMDGKTIEGPVQANVELLGSSSTVDRRAVGFWVPQKFRTTGKHTVTVRAGHMESYRYYWFFTRQRTVWDTVKEFTVEFTGVKRPID